MDGNRAYDARWDGRSVDGGGLDGSPADGQADTGTMDGGQRDADQADTGTTDGGQRDAGQMDVGSDSSEPDPDRFGFELVVNGLVYLNTGSPTASNWVRHADWDLPRGDGRAAFGDLDGDGDLDLLFGERLQNKACLAYRNVGSSTAPRWSRHTDWDPPRATEISYLGYITPTVGDLDGDGDLDLIYGAQYGGPVAYANVGSASSPSWERRNVWDVPGAGGNHVAATLGDLDGDGDLDVLQDIVYTPAVGYRNEGSTAAPVWTATSAWPVAKVGSWEFSSTVADLDGDGDLDLIYGNRSGAVVAFRNEGSAQSPTFVRHPAWDGPTQPSAAAPTLVNLDGQ